MKTDRQKKQKQTPIMALFVVIRFTSRIQETRYAATVSSSIITKLEQMCSGFGCSLAACRTQNKIKEALYRRMGATTETDAYTHAHTRIRRRVSKIDAGLNKYGNMDCSMQ